MRESLSRKVSIDEVKTLNEHALDMMKQQMDD